MGRSVCRNSNSAVDNLVCANSRAKSSPVRSATTCDVREGLRPSSVARSSSPIYSVFRRRKKVVICSRRVAPAGVAVSCQLAKRAARQRSASSRSDKFSGGAGKAPGSTVDERRARRSTISLYRATARQTGANGAGLFSIQGTTNSTNSAWQTLTRPFGKLRAWAESPLGRGILCRVRADFSSACDLSAGVSLVSRQ